MRAEVSERTVIALTYRGGAKRQGDLRRCADEPALSFNTVTVAGVIV
jgi:hypothetical protein